MKKKQKEPWQIAAARYCVENSEKGFAFEDLKKYIQSIYSVNEGHIYQFFEEELQWPAGRKFSRNERGGSWIPPLDLVSKVTDYDELKEARKNAKHAFWFSIIAIIVSAFTLFVTIKQTNLTEIQSASERIKQIRITQSVIALCQYSPELEQSGLFESSTGKQIPCKKVLEDYKGDTPLEKIRNILF